MSIWGPGCECGPAESMQKSLEKAAGTQEEGKRITSCAKKKPQEGQQGGSPLELENEGVRRGSIRIDGRDGRVRDQSSHRYFSLKREVNLLFFF